MIVNLRLRKNIKHLTLIERLQILPLTDGTVTVGSVIPDRLVVLLLHTTPALTVEHVDDLLRQRGRRRRNNPPREGVNPEHWKNHTLATRQQTPSEPDLGRSLQRMHPDLRFPLLELLNTPKRMIVESTSKIEADHRRFMLLDKSQEFGRGLFVLGSLNHRHHRLLNTSFFHPSLSKAQMTLIVIKRMIQRMLDCDDV